MVETGRYRRNAASIPVASFRTTLFWPLTLNLPPGSPAGRVARDGAPSPAIDKVLQRQVARLLALGCWREVPDLLDHIAPPGDPKAADSHLAGSYSELTYFHDFVQQFLFARPMAKGRAGLANPLRLFTRRDLGKIDIVFEDHGRTSVTRYAMVVERLNLYVTHLGIAILALELHMPETTDAAIKEGPWSDSSARGGDAQLRARGLTLADVQRFNSGFRRAHAPFLYAERERGEASPPLDLPSEVACAVTWYRAGETTPARRFVVPDAAHGPAAIARSLRAMPDGPRGIPPLPHFRWLIEGEKPTAGWKVLPLGSEEEGWRHVADDRLPLVSTVILPDHVGNGVAPYDTISDGDWARLCFVDPPGSDNHPYAKRFIERDWDRHAYDRFHYGPGESTDAPSRFLLSGYSLIAVGGDKFFRRNIQQHMRRHYFQLMLLALIEKASLLAVSSRITLAISDYEGMLASDHRQQAERRLEATLQQVEHDFLQYVHRFRFTGVSEQVQPTELFERLRERMRLPALYADIKEELTTATGFLALRSDKRQAGHAERLSVIATFGVILGLAFALLGMNVLTAEDVEKMLRVEATSLRGWRSAVGGVGTVLLTIALCSMLGLGLAAATRGRRGEPDEPLAIRLRQILEAMALLGFGAGGLALVAALHGPVWPVLAFGLPVLLFAALVRYLQR